MKLFSRNHSAAAAQTYIAEYMSAVNRTESLGLKAPSRVLVKKPCVDPDVTLPVLLDYFDRHTPEELLGQTLAINVDLTAAPPTTAATPDPSAPAANAASAVRQSSAPALPGAPRFAPTPAPAPGTATSPPSPTRRSSKSASSTRKRPRKPSARPRNPPILPKAPPQPPVQDLPQ